MSAAQLPHGPIIHLLIAGARVKTVRSHLSINDLAALAADGGRPAGPPPPPPEDGAVLEVDRTVARNGIVSLGARQMLAAEILVGRRVSIRIERQTLQFSTRIRLSPVRRAAPRGFGAGGRSRRRGSSRR